MRLLFLLASLALLSARACAAANSTYYEAAMKAANWIVASSARAADGVYWRDAETGQHIVNYNRTFDLYSGISGSALFLVEAYRASGNPVYMQTAIASTDYMRNRLDHILASGGGHDNILGHAGVAGIGYWFIEMWQQTRNATYKTAADRCLQFVLNKAVQTPTGLRLNKAHSVHWGSAGIALYLLHTYKFTAEESLLRAATDAGRDLLTFGQPSHGGLRWFWRGTSGFEWTGFGGGTAGIGFFFATLYHFTGDRTFLTAAESAAQYLINIADKGKAGDECNVPLYGVTQPTLFYLTWCGGPPGTARLFHRLFQVTNNATWLTWTYANGNSLFNHLGEPPFNFVWHNDTKDPIWDNVGQCDGASAPVEFMCYVQRTLFKKEYLIWARKIADNIVLRGKAVGSDGLQWIVEEQRVDPVRTRGAFTGYFEGAAGIGSVLLGLDETIRGVPLSQSIRIPMPDSPWNFGFV